jgi:hypothetical protein
MCKQFFAVLAAALGILVFAPSTRASISYDQSATNAVIYGTGNVNSLSFAVDRVGDLELGLRAHTRFVDDAAAKSNGAGLYSSFAQIPGLLGSWNFDFSINTNTGGMGVNVGDPSLTYRLDIDYDPGVGTSFFSFDPINDLPFFDHSFGDNTTADSAGTEAVDAVTYATLKASSNLVQNSWNLGFFPGVPAYDPNAPGLYDVVLSAFDTAGTQIGSVGIQAQVGAGAAVPEAASFVVWGLLGLTCGGFLRRGRRG